MAPRLYRIIRVRGIQVRRNAEGKATTHYLVQWVGYARQADWTYVSSAKLIHTNGQSHIVDFAAWTDYQAACRANRTVTPLTRAQWEQDRNMTRHGADHAGKCVVRAFRAATRLLGQPEVYSEARVRAFVASGRGVATYMPWKDVVALVNYSNYEQRKVGLPRMVFPGKKASLLVGTHRGCADLPITAGVYFCIGVNVKGARHCFVLEHTGDAVLMHDTLVGKHPVAYNKANAEWIRSWAGLYRIRFE